MRKHRVRVVFCLVLPLVLSGCSSPSPLEVLENGNCTDGQKVLVEKHISSQIAAISAQDFVAAYSFAAPTFRASIELEQFELIIKAQYQVLISNQGFTFGECLVEESQFRQEVEVNGALQDAKLAYVLEVDQLNLGVLAASILRNETDLKI
jgi:predicted component of type VI protein secretion system